MARADERRGDNEPNPRLTARYASGLIAAVVVLAFLIPDGPLRLDERWARLMEDVEGSLLTHVALVFNAVGHGILRALTTGGVGLMLLIKNRRAALLSIHPRRGTDATTSTWSS